MAATAQAKGPKPFWLGAARHRDQLTTQTFTPGQTLEIPLRRQGYLAALVVNVNGSVNVTAGGTINDPDEVDNWFQNIGIRSPQGSYVHAYTMRQILDFNDRLHRSVGPHSDPKYATWVPATLANNQAVNVNFVIPVALNTGLNVATGMLMRQLPNNEFTLELACSTIANIVNGGTCVATLNPITVTIWQLWFEAVNPAAVVPPSFKTVVRLRRQQFQNLAQGDNLLEYAVQPTLTDALFRTQLNGVADDADITTISMNSNYSNNIETRQGTQIRHDNYLHLGKALRKGNFLLDFFDDSDGVNVSRARDYINSRKASQMDFVVTVAQGANTANSKVDALFRELVALGIYR